MPVILDWCPGHPPDDLVRQTAKALDDGGLVALPTEAGYVLAASPAALGDPIRPPGLPDGLAVARLDGFFDAGDFFARVSTATPTERALASRVWPGPVGIVHPDAPFPGWVPSHLAAGAILASRRGPLAMFEINGGQPFEPSALGDAVAVVVSDGLARPGPVTLVRVNDDRWAIERRGVMSDVAIRGALARQIVFVCTGNTCRSPMAEGLFKVRLADRLGCTVAELPGKGYVVQSAGTSAVPNDPATAESVDAVREFGVDLSAHQSRHASADLIARADDVIAMTRAHLVTLAGQYPVLGGSLRMFCGADGDLDDPISGGPAVYRECAATVRQHVDRLITEMGLP
jgi:protein arginine phosphatase